MKHGRAFSRFLAQLKPRPRRSRLRKSLMTQPIELNALLVSATQPLVAEPKC